MPRKRIQKNHKTRSHINTRLYRKKLLSTKISDKKDTLVLGDIIIFDGGLEREDMVTAKIIEILDKGVCTSSEQRGFKYAFWDKIKYLYAPKDREVKITLEVSKDILNKYNSTLDQFKTEIMEQLPEIKIDDNGSPSALEVRKITFRYKAVWFTLTLKQTTYGLQIHCESSFKKVTSKTSLENGQIKMSIFYSRLNYLKRLIRADRKLLKQKLRLQKIQDKKNTKETAIKLRLQKIKDKEAKREAATKERLERRRLREERAKLREEKRNQKKISCRRKSKGKSKS
jgi:hypothetical protein